MKSNKLSELRFIPSRDALLRMNLSLEGKNRDLLAVIQDAETDLQRTADSDTLDAQRVCADLAALFRQAIARATGQTLVPADATAFQNVESPTVSPTEDR